MTPTESETQSSQVLKNRKSDLRSWVLIIASMAASAPATWWVLGRLDHSGDWIVDPDYAIPPPQIPRTLAHVLGFFSVLLAFAGFGVLINLVRTKSWPAYLLGVCWPGFAAAGYAGMAAHIMTAPVIGANFGAVFIVVGAGPVGVVLLAISLGSFATKKRDVGLPGQGS